MEGDGMGWQEEGEGEEGRRNGGREAGIQGNLNRRGWQCGPNAGPAPGQHRAINLSKQKTNWPANLLWRRGAGRGPP